MFLFLYLYNISEDDVYYINYFLILNLYEYI
jgi:hypothetical protein